MPPISYIITALALAAVVAAGLFLTRGYAIFLLYWAFGVAAAVLALLGIVRISQALALPVWVSLLLVSPIIVWGAERLRDLFASPAIFAATSIFFNVGATLALTAAAIGCVRLIEIVSGPNLVTRIAYSILAIGVLQSVFILVQYAVGATWTRTPAYAAFRSWTGWPLLIANYIALIAAPAVLVLRRHIEFWVLIPIVGLAVWRLWPRTSGPSSWVEGLSFSLQPIMFFVAAAAVWRIGSVLRAQRTAPDVVTLS